MPLRTRYSAGAPCWVDCISPDLTGSQAFYGSLLGWEFTVESPGYQLATLEGRIIGGFGAAPPGVPPRASWSVYLATKDVDHTCALVRQLGGRVVMSPVPAGDDGRLFLAVDPSDVTVGFWEGNRAEGVVLADEPGAVSGHELRVPDARRAARFYGDLFDYRLSPGGEELELDGAGLARVVESDQGRPLWLPYFGAVDPADAVRRAVELGAEVVRSGRGEPTVLRDPWGAEFGLTAVGAP
ncbi:VOC family protein [Kitasatospora sp. NPDC050543]|uniref:VOC family protein n=1 Tax=Kitasatospora sp. NPDC050543 TaxID=3364054 RepID=UPI0037B6E265